MIEVSNLFKKYGPVEAVRGVSFKVEPGHIYGFLGPNGAGKSTTMNIITGCLAATSGEVKINGHDIYEDAIEAKKLIGYLPEQPPLYPDMTPEEYLIFVGRAKGLKGDALYNDVDRVMEKTQIAHVGDRLIRNLSKGYRQRVGIAQAILANPKIIILDEPTVGLDPIQIVEIRELIRELSKSHTVILSSHILSEVSAVCDYVIIISRGIIVASDTIENLNKGDGETRLIKITSRNEKEGLREKLSGLEGVKSVTVSHSSEGILAEICTSNDTDPRDGIFKVYSELGCPILSMSSDNETLEDIFMRLTRDEYIDMIEEHQEKRRRDNEKKEKKKGGKTESKNPYYGKNSDRADKSEEEYTPLFTDENKDKED